MDIPFNIAEPKALLLLLTIPPVIYLGLLNARARKRDRNRVAASVVIRTLILLALTLAVVGLQWISSGGPLNVVFLVDESASLTPAAHSAALDYVKQAIAKMGPDDRAGVVRFGENAIVDRAISGAASWQPSAAVPGALATDVSDAIQAGLALFPEGGSRRLILLSDGLENEGKARDVLVQAHATGVQLSVVPLGAQSANEVAVDQVSSPQSVPAGQQYQARVLVNSTSDRDVTVTLFDGQNQIGQQTASIKAGKTVLEFAVQSHSEGFQVLRATVSSADDRYAENNSAESYTVVRAQPSVLIVASSTSDSLPLQTALSAVSVTAKIVTPDAVPVGMDGLLAYDVVVVANVSATDLGADRQALLQTYVRDTGHGLVMLGGELSYGAGGYLRSTLEKVLPVSMDVRTSEQKASIAMTYVMDKSGSMGRCHCGNAAQYDPSMRTEFGPSKVEIAKQAIAHAADLLNSSDKVGVVGFDQNETTLIPSQPMADLGVNRILKALEPVQAEGASNLYGGLQAGIDQLQGSGAELKHLVMISDGWTQQADYSSLIAELNADKITLTTVGAGDGPGEILQSLAELGGGKYYSATNIYDLPNVLLKDTVALGGLYYIEKPFRPASTRANPITNGLDPGAFPDLLGYNATTLKPTADGILTAPNGDPILAVWQYGLGKSVAWTPDMKGRWSTNWVRWPLFSQFVGQMVQWASPGASTGGLQSTYTLSPSFAGDAQNVAIRLESLDVSGTPRNGLVSAVVLTDSAGSAVKVAMIQESPGVYSGVAQTLTQGTYHVGIEQRTPGSNDLVARSDEGLVIPY
ncbi:MAG: VWA domain-containing protein, partial [Chloroflexota bacterium]